MIADWEVHSLALTAGEATHCVARGSDPLAPATSPRVFVEDLVRRWAGDDADFSAITTRPAHVYEWLDERPTARRPVSIRVQILAN
ncbi:hypothetical protein [Sulfobacillus sp. hq2]|uniref:hypothetical protein n=1 Tax=Sulfobacillus TaxID=28033 RepID=UPI000CD28A0D|nr:hypothetical protein [Sulfobacillus sp. hq2]POB12346.1 hypothetical protein CO251_00035 [Sulfobacillus sp. hq2]